MIRKLAQTTGQRAATLGLTADDLVSVDDYMQELRENNKTPAAARDIRSQAEQDELKLRVSYIQGEEPYHF